MSEPQREEAKRLGLKYYQPEMRCDVGHACQRYTKSRICVECAKIKEKNRYAANKEKINAKCKRWREENKEKDRKRQAKWRKENPKLCLEITHAWRAKNAERFKATYSRWLKANRGKASVYNRSYRARMRGNGGHHTADDVFDILKIQRGKCAVCAIMLKNKYHVDHIMPLKRGGSNGRENLQILCQHCNNTKSARCPIEFMQSLGRLL